MWIPWWWDLDRGICCRDEIASAGNFRSHNISSFHDERGAREARPLPPLFLELYFSRTVLLKIHFCVIFQGIQNFFGPSLPESRRGL